MGSPYPLSYDLKSPFLHLRPSTRRRIDDGIVALANVPVGLRRRIEQRLGLLFAIDAPAREAA